MALQELKSSQTSSVKTMQSAVFFLYAAVYTRPPIRLNLQQRSSAEYIIPKKNLLFYTIHPMRHIYEFLKLCDS